MEAEDTATLAKVGMLVLGGFALMLALIAVACMF